MTGYLSAPFYCIITAISMLTIHHSMQQASATVVMLYTFLVCFLFFNFMNVGKLHTIYRTIKDNPWHILFLNLTTTFTWVTTFWSLKFITPVLFLTVVMGVPTVVSFILTMWEVKKFDKKACFLAVIISSLIITIVFLIKNLLSLDTYDFVVGTTVASLSGISLSLYMKISKALHLRSDLSPSQILCLRFFVLIAFSLIASVYHMSWGIFTQGINFFYIIFLALVSTILPLYFFQTSVHRIGVLKTSYFLPFTPILAYQLQWFFGVPFDATVFFVMLILSGVLAYSATVKIH